MISSLIGRRRFLADRVSLARKSGARRSENGAPAAVPFGFRPAPGLRGIWLSMIPYYKS
jgi:hypothetical protein